MPEKLQPLPKTTCMRNPGIIIQQQEASHKIMMKFKINVFFGIYVERL
jgi:hypothetical protein